MTGEWSTWRGPLGHRSHLARLQDTIVELSIENVALRGKAPWGSLGSVRARVPGDATDKLLANRGPRHRGRLVAFVHLRGARGGPLPPLAREGPGQGGAPGGLSPLGVTRSMPHWTGRSRPSWLWPRSGDRWTAPTQACSPGLLPGKGLGLPLHGGPRSGCSWPCPAPPGASGPRPAKPWPDWCQYRGPRHPWLRPGDWDYAFKAHFDFVVHAPLAERHATHPLFAVEFDGPGHTG